MHDEMGISFLFTPWLFVVDFILGDDHPRYDLPCFDLAGNCQVIKTNEVFYK